MSKTWKYHISSKHNLFNFNLKEVWDYRDLLSLFVRRNIVTVYKQTILGPLWYLIEPLFTAIVFTLIFNNVAKIDTGNVPPFLFNLSGVIIWNYFRSCLSSTSSVFKSNAGIFGKVYFPRLIVPLAIIFSNLFKFSIQLFIFIVFYVYYLYHGAPIGLNRYVLFFPIMVFLMGVLSMGLGMIISAAVTKYRDLNILMNFGIQLLAYISGVMYPLSFFKESLPNYAWLVDYNPIAFVIDFVRRILLEESPFQLDYFQLLYVLIISVFIFVLGVLVFNKSEKNFIDTV